MKSLVTEEKKNYSFLLLILSLVYSVIIIISNITSNKITELYDVIFAANTLFLPLTYIIIDVVTEVYGLKMSRQIIWFGLISNIVVVLAIILTINMPAVHNQPNYFDLTFQQPYRIIIASILSCLLGAYINSYIMAKLKSITQSAFYHSRAIASTFLGAICETILFCTISFLNIVTPETLLQMVISQIVIKIIIAILCVHLSYILVKFLHKNKYN